MIYDDDGEQFKKLFKVVCRECGNEATVYVWESFCGSELTGSDPGYITFGCPTCGPRKDLELKP